MSNKRSQKQRIIGKLKREGFVTRNECLDMPYGDKITRLGAIIFDLKQEGYEFETKDDGRDFIYTWINKTTEVYEQVEKDGQIVVVKKTIKG